MLTRLGNGAKYFPGLKETDLQAILESSRVASFGRGKEEVTDKSVRDAYVLEIDQFLCSFQPRGMKLVEISYTFQ